MYPGLPIERIRPRTSLLRYGLDKPAYQPFFIPEEEVPKSGVRVVRTWQRVRQNAERVTYQLSFSSIGGFDEEVTLSANGIPSGLSFSFSNSSIIPPANVSLNIEGLENAAPGAYTINIAATSASNDLAQEVILQLEQDIAEPIPANSSGKRNIRSAASSRFYLVWRR